MNSHRTVINAYKGLLYNFFLDIKKVAFVGFIIVVAMVVFDLLMTIIFLNADVSVSNDGVGTIFVGAVVMLITFFIYVLASTTKVELHSKFAFPINRTIYAVSNFIFMIFGSFLLLAIVTIVAPVEIIIYQLIDLSSNKLIYFNHMSLYTFTVGFIATWAYLIFFGSLTYGIFMYIRKYLMYTLPVIAILITTILLFGWLGDIMRYIFLEDDLLILLLKLIGISVISHLLGFIPLKRLEVQ